MYVLGGTVAGPLWTDAASPDRSAAILELACRNGDVDLTRPPILLLTRTVDPSSVAALDACGFDYPDDYIVRVVPGGPPGVTVMVPR